MSDDDDVTKARLAIGLPRDRFFDVGGGIGGVPIVCKCVHCGTLFGSRSYDLADVDHICRGDCGRPYLHHEQPPSDGAIYAAISQRDMTAEERAELDADIAERFRNVEQGAQGSDK